MKKTAAAALLFTFLFAAITPNFAQKQSDERIRRVAPTQFDTVSALTDGSGVLVRWYMKTETAVSGYDVYRVTATDKERITPSPVIGSAGRYGERIAYGEMYEFFDLDGDAGAEYYVEGILLNGNRFTSKATTSSFVKSLEETVGTSSETFIKTRAATNSNFEQRSSSISGELQDIVGLHQQEPDPVNQRVIASKAGAKIAVKKDGFYRVTASELQSANFQTNSDSTKWRLFMNGVEQSIIVGPNGQYIEFYGKGVDTPETDTRIYYLVNDIVEGKRIRTKMVRPIAGGAASTRYSVVARKKVRENFHNEIFNGLGENFLGGIIVMPPSPSIPPPVVRFNLSGVDFSVPSAKIVIRNFGFTNNSHVINSKINGNALPAITQFGNVFFTGTFTIPTSHLVEGVNELELNTSSPGDQSLFDFVEVSYQRKYVADDNKLSFYTPGFRKVDLTGFTTSNVRVFDTTFDGEPVLLANVPVVAGESSFTAKIPSSRMMVGYALEDTALLQSPSITQNLPSTISDTANAADMLIVSHGAPSFMNPAETWANYRRSSAGGGFNVKVIDVADVFDEFSYGATTAASLKSFLEHATTEWAQAPAYVLLIGDSTYDPRNYEGYGNFYLMPAQSVTLLLEESVSDEALGDFDNDGLSDLAIGRIPARTGAQITTAFNKTVAYETVQQSFSRGVLFAHDSSPDFDFEGMSQQLSQILPPGTPVSMVNAGEANANTTLINRMNEGKFLVNYSGHGSSGIWANSSFFQNNSITQLTNINNPSLFSMLTCLNGFFVRTNGDSLAEVLMFSTTGGSVAGWASTSETTPDIQLIMAIKFYEEMSTGNLERMGDLIKVAKTSLTAGPDVRLSWVLIGDPALKVP